MDKHIHAVVAKKFVRCCALIAGLLLWGVGRATAISPSTSYRRPNIRHVQGAKSVGIHVGMTSLGKSLSASYGHQFSPRWRINTALGAEVDNLKNNTYGNMFTQPVLGYMLYTDYKRWFFTALSGAKMHIERYKSPKRNKRKKPYTGNIALVAGGESELFFVGNLSLSLSGGLRVFLLKSPYGKVDYFLNLGIKTDF